MNDAGVRPPHRCILHDLRGSGLAAVAYPGICAVGSRFVQHDLAQEIGASSAAVRSEKMRRTCCGPKRRTTAPELSRYARTSSGFMSSRRLTTAQ